MESALGGHRVGPVWGEDGGEQEIVLVGQEAQKCEGVQLTCFKMMEK